MKLKSYFADTVEEAMAKARQELGADAMLVNSRKAAPDARHLGIYEVVFVTEGPVPEAESAPAAVTAGKRAPDRLTQQMAELKQELEGMRRTISRSALAPSVGRDATPDGSDAYGTLTAAEVNPEIAREMIRAAELRVAKSPLAAHRTLRRVDPAAFRNALAEELMARINVQPILGRGAAKPRIVALIGPPGVGKTTTLVKLAVTYGLSARRPVLLLSTDTYRVAAAEQLRSYASILGVGFQLVETVPALAQAIEEHQRKDLIFIDTPGLSPADVGEHARLYQFLSTREDVDTHLVVSSSMKPVDLSRVIDSFEPFHAQRLLFTRLDETTSFGPIFNESVRTGKALSFFANGQRIPEDLEVAAKNRLTELVLNGTHGLALSAA